jgi:two-component system sensor histidine kinase HydH
VKGRTQRTSLFAALAAWLLFSALAVFIIGGQRDRARLIRDNDNERILNTLFTSLRDYNDFGSAIESNETLRQRVTGIAVYDNRAMLQSWGKAPPEFDASIITKETPRRFNRYTIPDRRGGTVKFVLYYDRQPGNERQSPSRAVQADRASSEAKNNEQRVQRQGNWFNVFSGGNYVYIDINHPAYWRTVTVTGILYPLSTTALLVLALAIRRLYVHNIEYRERIKAQANLVMLGTAASTLAHEIKNPLHSIKLQTSILEKMFGPAEEITHVNEEVDRLAFLTCRVNDYLRSARGNPEITDIAAVITECSIRVFGFSILDDKAPANPLVRIDSERAKSVFENIMLNASESGGRPEECRAALESAGNLFVARVYDRGRGVPEADIQRVFDPFFTTKSRGTGIGLALSKRFVEAAGGGITLENRPGGGALVNVTLPRAEES